MSVIRIAERYRARWTTSVCEHEHRTADAAAACERRYHAAQSRAAEAALLPSSLHRPDYPTAEHGVRFPGRVIGDVSLDGETHLCGYCGCPVSGDIARLNDHVAFVCPVAREERRQGRETPDLPVSSGATPHGEETTHGQNTHA
ncbi:MAG: hypothetical protein ACRDQD_01105 [Nocardioidaceae bacterium]